MFSDLLKCFFLFKRAFCERKTKAAVFPERTQTSLTPPRGITLCSSAKNEARLAWFASTLPMLGMPHAPHHGMLSTKESGSKESRRASGFPLPELCGALLKQVRFDLCFLPVGQSLNKVSGYCPGVSATASNDTEPASPPALNILVYTHTHI